MAGRNSQIHSPPPPFILNIGKLLAIHIPESEDKMHSLCFVIVIYLSQTFPECLISAKVGYTGVQKEQSTLKVMVYV